MSHPDPSVPSSRLFAVRCGGCAEAISHTELVMRVGAAVFHLHCFTCSVCSCRLQTGDRCVLREGQLLCAREDYHRSLASPTSSYTGTSCLPCVCSCTCACKISKSNQPQLKEAEFLFLFTLCERFASIFYSHLPHQVMVMMKMRRKKRKNLLGRQTEWRTLKSGRANVLKGRALF